MSGNARDEAILGYLKYLIYGGDTHTLYKLKASTYIVHAHYIQYKNYEEVGGGKWYHVSALRWWRRGIVLLVPSVYLLPH